MMRSLCSNNDIIFHYYNTTIRIATKATEFDAVMPNILPSLNEMDGGRKVEKKKWEERCRRSA